MPIVTWDHVHLRSPYPEATAAWLEHILGGVVVRGPGRIDVKLGGANIFIAPVAAGDGVNNPPVTPYQGLDHFGLAVKDIDAVAAEIFLGGRGGHRVGGHGGRPPRRDSTRPHPRPAAQPSCETQPLYLSCEPISCATVSKP